MDSISRQRLRMVLARKAALALFVPGFLLLLGSLVLPLLTQFPPVGSRVYECTLFVAMTGIALALLAAILEEYRSELDDLINLALKLERARTFDGPFCLLLRSFTRYAAYAERLQDFRRTLVGMRELYVAALPATNTLTDSIQTALRGKAILLAVGEAPYGDIVYLNSGDERWRTDVELLAAHAQALIMLPESSGGVLEEMQLVRSHSLWEKTIVIMPRLRREAFLLETIGVSYRVTGRTFKEWEELRDSLTAHGYKLPPPSEAGLVFTVNPDFSVRHSAPLPEGEKDEGLSEALAAVMPHLPGGWRPLRDVFPLVERSVPRVTFDAAKVLSGNWVSFLALVILFGAFGLAALLSGLTCWRG